MTPQALLSADELLHLNLPNKRTELVRGVLVVREPPGGRHGRITAELALAIGNYNKAHGLGTVYAGDTGFTLARGPDTVRGPDLAFVGKARVPAHDPVGYLELGPDLAVEVLSPGTRPGEVLAKVADWIGAGTRLVWLIDPQRRVARVYRADGSESLVTDDQRLDGEDVLPGFSLDLQTIL
ncbi:MAG TPA: Uma2 family endonuclease [Gemmatimonadales bacterium]|nr:Uma2 family endonuclease [Gemmatimonadales bacterium]